MHDEQEPLDPPVAAVALGLGATAPAKATIAEYTGLGAGSPAGISSGAGAAVWFAEQGNPGGLGRMTTGGARTEFPAGTNPAATWPEAPTALCGSPSRTSTP